jgi:hypothetical protein
MLPSGLGEAEMYLPVFDYFDSSKDLRSRQGKRESPLARSAEALAQDLVNAAVYRHQILGWRDRAHESGDLGTAVVITRTKKGLL